MESKIIRQLEDFVSEKFKALKRYEFLAVILSLSVLLLTGFILLITLESLFFLPGWFKIFLVTALVIGSIKWYSKRSKIFNRFSYKTFYRAASDYSGLPEIKYVLDLQHDNTTSLVKPAIEQVSATLYIDSVQNQINRFVQQSHAVQVFRSSILLLLAVSTFTIYAYYLNLLDFKRGLIFWASYNPPNPYHFTVHPGNFTYEHGEPFTIEINFKSNDRPKKVTLALKTEIESSFRNLPLNKVNESLYVSPPITLTNSASYQINMDNYQSDMYGIDIQLRPRFQQFSAKIIPPSYTLLKTDSIIYPFSSFNALYGSQIQLSGKSNKPLRTLHLSKTEGDTLFSELSELRYEFQAFKTDTIAISLFDTVGLKSRDTLKFTIQIKNDAWPTVTIFDPEPILELRTPEKLTIAYEARDDFNLTASALNVEISRAFLDKPEIYRIPLNLNTNRLLYRYEWDLTTYKLNPLDKVTYWIEVKDNDRINGPKSATSSKQIIKIPSLTDYIDQLAGFEDNVDESFETVSDQFDTFMKNYDEFFNDLKDKPDESWKRTEDVERLKQQQDKIKNSVEELNKAFDELKKDISGNNLLDRETLQKYEELKQLLEELDNEDLREALQKLQESLSNFNPNQIQQAIENMKFNEEKYKERLNRTLELFKSLKLDARLQQSAKALEELAEREEAISKKNSSQTDEVIKEQEQLKNELEKLSEKLDSYLNDSPESRKEATDKLSEQMQDQLQNTEKQLQENLNQLQNGSQNEKTQQQQQFIQNSLSQMSEQLRNAMVQSGQQRAQINKESLERILFELLTLSFAQEKINGQIDVLADRSAGFVEYARTQRNIKRQFGFIADTLFKVSTELPSLSNAINEKKLKVDNHLGKSLISLAERTQSRSLTETRMALGNINELATLIADVLEQLQNSQGGSGAGKGPMSMEQLLEQLSESAKQQQQLNQQMQDMINDIQGERLTKEAMDRLSDMAEAQNRIRKQLEELKKSGSLESGDKTLSDLERLAEEMEETINQLRGGQADRILIKRQQNILSRMLEAERALQERGEDEKREGDTAKDYKRSNPPPLTYEELQKQIELQLKNPDQTQFKESFKELIRLYFEALERRMNEDDINP